MKVFLLMYTDKSYQETVEKIFISEEAAKRFLKETKDQDLKLNSRIEERKVLT